ncbi:MAG: endonuclease V, partial [Thermoanaerobaculum sp.]|nr:endonuclease V [Thermoanaerobaculum sp.]
MKRVSGQGDRPPQGQEPAGWPLPAEAEAWARHLVGRLKQAPLAVLPRWVVGADVAYDSGVAVAAAVVWDLKEGFPVWWRALRRPISAPYQPGLFFLREAPCLLPLLQRLPVRRWVGMVHGHGTAHPWGVGLACVVGA